VRLATRTPQPNCLIMLHPPWLDGHTPPRRPCNRQRSPISATHLSEPKARLASPCRRVTEQTLRKNSLRIFSNQGSLDHRCRRSQFSLGFGQIRSRTWQARVTPRLGVADVSKFAWASADSAPEISPFHQLWPPSNVLFLRKELSIKNDRQ